MSVHLPRNPHLLMNYWLSLARLKLPRKRFRLLFSYFQREPTYSLALASLSAYAKNLFPDVEVSLVSVLQNDDVQEYVRRVAKHKPDLIAVSAMHPTWSPMLPYLEALKGARPATPVVVGGYQAIFSPQETIGHPAVNYICAGDGEIPLAQLIRRLKDGETQEAIPGLWEKRGSGEIVKSSPSLTPNLDEIPFPDYTIFEKDGEISWLSSHAIESERLITMPVMSGRGCPYRCSYCCNTPLLEMYRGQGNYLRKYNQEKLIEELIRLRDRYGIQYFQFMDETFLFDKRSARRLLGLYREQIGLPFSMFTRVEQMDEDFCRYAAAAGCHSMWFGVESGSEAYRRRYLARRMSNRKILDAAEMARRQGIRRMVFCMVGMPFESRENILETLELTKLIGPERAIFSQYLPLPGTPLYKVAEQADLLLDSTRKQQMWSIGTLNIKEQAGSVSAPEFKELVDEILTYVWEGNRIDD